MAHNDHGDFSTWTFNQNNLYSSLLHLRQIKLQNKQSFSADLETLSGTLETHSESAKQTLRNDAQNLNNIVMIGTRRNTINTEIEPNNEGSKKSNVDEVTILEPNNKKIITNLGNKYNIYHKLILHMKLDTQTYYNLRIILGLEHN